MKMKDETKKALHGYECACNLLLVMFKRKYFHESNYACWMSGEVGGMADFEDCAFPMFDMFLALKHDVSTEHLDEYIEASRFYDDANTFYHFLIEKGYIEYSAFDEVKSRKAVEEARKSLEASIKDYEDGGF